MSEPARVVPSGSALLGALPYLGILAVCFGLYRLADGFGGVIGDSVVGPSTWPKMIIWALAGVSAYECVRRLGSSAFKRYSGEKLLAPVDPDGAPDDENHGETSELGPVFGAIVATLVYLVAFETVGFTVDTFIFMLTIMWLGRFRRLIVSALLCGAATIGLLFAFMKLVFVPLPLGVGPFAVLSTTLLRVLGIH